LGTRERSGTLLAFDYGEKRIGVAVGDISVRLAHPLITLSAPSRDARFAEIARLIAEWQPVSLVVGLPVHADGTPHELTVRVKRFANQLTGRFHLPVELVDERLTTREADAALAQGGLHGRRRRAVRDQVAAQLILQTYFEHHAP